MFQLIIQYVYKNEVFDEFIGFLDCHRNNYGNTGGDIKPKTNGEVISKFILNILDT